MTRSEILVHYHEIEYCKHGNVRFGVIFAFFAILPSLQKFPSRENKTHMTSLRKYERYRENYPHVKDLDQRRKVANPLYGLA